MKAILGGTFDPVHLGHVHAARRARNVLQVSSVTLLLAARPRHRAEPLARLHDRWRMLCLATRQEEDLVASDLEIVRPGPSYTVDSLSDLRGDEPLVWLIGRDAVADVPSWHRASELATLCHLVVLDRPGGDRSAPLVPGGFELVDNAADLVGRPCGGLYCLPNTMLDVSASRVRRRIAEGGDAGALLPPGVWSYIREQGLYRPAGSNGGGAGLLRSDAVKNSELNDRGMCRTGDGSNPRESDKGAARCGVEPDAESAKRLAALVMAAVDDRKGVDPVALDVSAMTELTDTMVIVSGTSNRHIKAIVDNVLTAAKRSGAEVLGAEGREQNDWVLIDLADVVVHVMSMEARRFYELERLWEQPERAFGAASNPERLLETGR